MTLRKKSKTVSKHYFLHAPPLNFQPSGLKLPSESHSLFFTSTVIELVQKQVSKTGHWTPTPLTTGAEGNSPTWWRSSPFHLIPLSSWNQSVVLYFGELCTVDLIWYIALSTLFYYYVNATHTLDDAERGELLYQAARLCQYSSTP